MKKFKGDKRNYVILALSLLVIFMSIGFAAFSTRLTINGTAKIASSWCVGFDSTQTSAYSITKGISTGTNPVASMSYSGTSCGGSYVPVVNLSSEFYQPGDKIEYTLTVVNKGTLDASIGSITVDGTTVTTNQVITKGNIIYRINMPLNSSLSANNGFTTMKVTAEFQNTNDISEYNLAESQSILIGLNVVQD